MKTNYKMSFVDDETIRLDILGDISDNASWYSDVNANQFAKTLQEHEGKNIDVHINSFGGSVSAGLTIYNTLRQHKGKITTYCDGFACSSASVVFMAGDERVMPKSSLLMIHNAWTYAEGNAEDFKKVAEDLEKITQPSVEIYKGVTGLDEETVKKMMDEETWIDADEALELGFATKVIDVVAQQSCSDMMFANLVRQNKELTKQKMDLENQIKEQGSALDEDDWAFYFN